MVRILKTEDSETKDKEINIHVRIDHLNIDMKVVSVKHLTEILTHQYEELNKNLSGSIIIHDDNKRTKA